MKNIKFLFLFFIAFFSFFLKVSPVFAGFGISPAEIYNDSLKPGSKFETEIVLSRSEADENLKVVIETELGETESWVKFEPSKEFVFPKGENRKTIKAIITVPNNAETKNYKGLLRIKASSADSSTSGVSIVQGARMEVTLVTTSLNVNLLNVKGTRIPDVNWGKPIVLFANIENNGNTQIAPDKIILEIQRLNKDSLGTQEVTKIEKITPNTTKEISVEFKNNNLSSEEYFGIVKVISEGKEIYSNRLVFKVIGAPAEGSKEIISTNNNQMIFKHILLPILLLTPTIIAIIFRKKTTKKSLKKTYQLLIIVYIVFVTILVYFYHQKLKSDKAKPGDVGNVQGETIEITPTIGVPPSDNSSSFIVDKEPGYPIYRTPDLNSHVIYTAQENEKFSVIKEENDWYYVTIKNGTGGWLSKTSVKKSE